MPPQAVTARLLNFVAAEEGTQVTLSAYASTGLRHADRDLRVASVQLILNAVVTSKLGGGLDFRVPVIGWKVQVGGRRSRQRTHTIDITLVPEDLRDRHELRDDPVEETLVEAITTIRAAVLAGSRGDDPLVLQTGTVELVFGVTDQGTISVGVDGELTEEVTNTLRIDLVGVAP